MSHGIAGLEKARRFGRRECPSVTDCLLDAVRSRHGRHAHGEILSLRVHVDHVTCHDIPDVVRPGDRDRSQFGDEWYRHRLAYRLVRLRGIHVAPGCQAAGGVA